MTINALAIPRSQHRPISDILQRDGSTYMFVSNILFALSLTAECTYSLGDMVYVKHSYSAILIVSDGLRSLEGADRHLLSDYECA